MQRALLITAVTLMSILSGCSTTYRAGVGKLSADPQWPFYRGEATSTGTAFSTNFTGRLNVVWEHKSKDKPVGPMTIYYGHLVYPGGKNKIRFIDLEDGRLSGSIKPHGQTQTGVVAKDSLVFFATGPRINLLKCVDITQGRKTWIREIVDASMGMLIFGDMLIVGTGGGTLLALDLNSGEQIWRFDSDSKFDIPPTLADTVLYQPGDEGCLYALNVLNGQELFRVALDGPLVSPVAISDCVYATDMYGHVYSIDMTDGRVNWRQKLSGPIWTSPAVHGGLVVVGHSGGEIVALDAADGEVVWTYDVVDVVRASPLIVGDFVVVGTLTGKLYSLSLSNGTLVDESEMEGAISASPVSDGERILVATDRGTITCFGVLVNNTVED